MSNIKKICSGEYEGDGFSISKDDFEANLWWLKIDGFTVREDFRTLKEAKEVGIAATANKHRITKIAQ
jgi:glutamine cyclotransferase